MKQIHKLDSPQDDDFQDIVVNAETPPKMINATEVERVAENEPFDDFSDDFDCDPTGDDAGQILEANEDGAYEFGDDDIDGIELLAASQVETKQFGTTEHQKTPEQHEGGDDLFKCTDIIPIYHNAEAMHKFVDDFDQFLNRTDEELIAYFNQCITAVDELIAKEQNTIDHLMTKYAALVKGNWFV